MKLKWKRDLNRAFSQEGGYRTALCFGQTPVILAWIYRLEDKYYLSLSGAHAGISHKRLKAEDYKQAARKAEKIITKQLEEWLQ